MWRGSREPSSVFRSPPFPNSTKRGSGPLGPPGLRRPAELGGGARRRRQAQRAGRGRGAGGAAPLRPASGRASAGAGLGAGPRRGGRAASPAVRSARNRGAGGCEAGGRTGPRERAAGRLGLAPGAGQLQRRRGRAGGAGPDRAAAAAAAAIGAARSGRRPGAGSGRRAPGGRRGAARREDDRGLRRAPRAALALRRAPGKLPPASRPFGSRGHRGAAPVAAGARTRPEGLSRAPPPRASLHPEAPALREAARGRQERGAAGAAASRGAKRGGMWVGGGPRELCLKRDPPSIPRPPQVRGRCSELGSPAPGQAARWRSRRALHRPGAASLRSWRAQPGPGLRAGELATAGREPGVLGTTSLAALPGARVSRRSAASALVFRVLTGTLAEGGQRMWTAGHPRRRAPEARLEPVSGGALAAGSEAGEPGARRAQGEGARERGPGARLLSAEPGSPAPRPAVLGGCRPRGRHAGLRGWRPWGGGGAAGVAGTPSRGRSASLLLRAAQL